jgi:quinoprotein glucose dehydrogenase
MYRKYARDKFPGYETEHDRVRLIEDTKGAGVADKSTVFADGFHTAADGLGAGVLARKGSVYYTCIPTLWLLKDTKGTGKADVRQSLATGFGVHVAFIGHDMHGLRIGPDGRLYFSIGDRGLNVKTKEGKTLFNPDSGAVLRCDLDGSNLEVVHVGLRNPQELAFDAFGNLFTVDNNSDSGDRARLVQIVEGGDSGWRTGYQYGSSFSDRGPFNAEKIWHLQHEGQPAYIVPPLAHITSGPSGLCFNYGATLLPARYKDHFFICDFRGSSGGSGVYSFAVKPKGASFEIADGHQFIWSVLATDCEFGPDGGFYISDWVEGWGLTGKGRIYRFEDPDGAKDPAVGQVKTLLAEGFDKRPKEELARLLAHPDLRIRQEAQFALVERRKEGLAVLKAATKDGKDRFARLHAIWGLGMLGRAGEDVLPELRPLLKDSDEEVRAQAARVWGWVRDVEGGDLIPLLKDPSLRVRFQAATSLGKPGIKPLQPQPLWDALVELLKENNDRDTYLRHAASLVLAKYPGQDLVSASKHESPAVRMAALLALRHRKNPVAWVYLDDPDPRIATEAARFFHDEEPAGTDVELAKRLVRPNLPEPYMVRALNANFRMGEAGNATAVAAFAARANAPEKWRVEALKMLETWASPGRRDRITGLTQNLGTRNGDIAAKAFRAHLVGIFAGSAKVCQEAARVAGTLGIKEVGPILFEITSDTKQPAETRVQTLQALDALKDTRLEKAVELALGDTSAPVRAEGRRIAALRKPEEAVRLLQPVLEKGDIIEKQVAFTTLGAVKTAEADQVLGQWLGKLAEGAVPAEVRLDLLEAAGARPGLKQQLADYEAAKPKTDHLAKWRETLAGGNGERGKRIFLTKSEVSCLRCHKAGGEGGDVGPDLAGIGSKQTREYLLESLVDPNRQIAKGYETLVLELTNGKSVTGILKAEDAKEVTLMTAEGQLLKIAKADIDSRRTGKSAMPEDVIKYLSRSEIRDLVEFLAGLKQK